MSHTGHIEILSRLDSSGIWTDAVLFRRRRFDLEGYRGSVGVLNRQGLGNLDVEGTWLRPLLVSSQTMFACRRVERTLEAQLQRFNIDRHGGMLILGSRIQDGWGYRSDAKCGRIAERSAAMDMNR
jgi:hypothetical protein